MKSAQVDDKLFQWSDGVVCPGVYPDSHGVHQECYWSA